MKLKISPHKTKISCYVCNNEDVFAICHHCHRAICEIHMPPARSQKYFFTQIIDNEFTDLDLADIGQMETAIHCSECQHYITLYTPIFYTTIFVGILIAFISLFMNSLLMLVECLVLGLAYIGVGLWGIHTENQIDRKKMQENRPSLPVFGRSASIKILERVDGWIEINEHGNYKTHLISEKGYLTFSLLFAFTDRERFKNYCRKYTYSQNSETSFDAGFISFQSRQEALEGQTTNCSKILGLKDRITEESFFLNSPTSQNHSWLKENAYDFSTDKKSTSDLPIQIIPVL